MKNFKSLIIRIFKCVINPIKFSILFGFFFSSLAQAESLTVTWEAIKIPGGNNNFVLGAGTHICKSSSNGQTLSLDRTELPSDVTFSDDGLIVFTSNLDPSKLADTEISQNRLDKPFDIRTDRVTTNSEANCDDVDGLAVNTVSNGALTTKAENIDVVNNGKIFFVVDNFGQLGKFNATTPNDVDGLTYETKISFSSVLGDSSIHSVEFSRDGTQLYTLSANSGVRKLTTFSLPGPFDISSYTQTHQVDFFDIGVTNDGAATEVGHDIKFNQDGSAMFLLIGNGTENSTATREKNYIYQFSLSKNFDVSTATKVGRLQMSSGFFAGRSSSGDQTGMPRGFTFSTDGMKLFIVEVRNGIPGVDHINQFALECPYGIAKCTSDSLATIGAQVELAKQNITLNVSTIFKRFEWIKRNRDQEKFSSANINFSYSNPLLESLAMSLEPNTKKALETLVSKKEKKEKNSKWSTWSLVDLSISNLDKLGFEKAKTVKSLGLTYGADRNFGKNRFLGWAIRYGDGESNIHQSKQNTELESLTLNLYGIVPTNENRYINAVVGLSALRFNNKYLGKLSGERNGAQAFTSINYRTKNTLGSLNVTPTGKFTYGVTRLTEYTDFISNTINSPAIDIRYAEDTFRSGELAAGFLFEIDKMIYEEGSLQPMGKIEILYDLTPNIDYKYTYQGETPVNKDTIIGAYSRKSLKTNIGYEWIFLNGFTISPSYERVISLSNNDRVTDAWRELYNERFIIKLSKSKEENSQFAFDFDPLTNNLANFSYAKDIGNFNLKLNSNYSSINNISDYGANIELFGTF